MVYLVLDKCHTRTSVLKTGKLEPAGFTGLMADQFEPVNKPNLSAGSIINQSVRLRGLAHFSLS
jgi:hypothetical protein